MIGKKEPFSLYWAVSIFCTTQSLKSPQKFLWYTKVRTPFLDHLLSPIPLPCAKYDVIVTSQGYIPCTHLRDPPLPPVACVVLKECPLSKWLAGYNRKILAKLKSPHSIRKAASFDKVAWRQTARRGHQTQFLSGCKILKDKHWQLVVY